MGNNEKDYEAKEAQGEQKNKLIKVRKHKTICRKRNQQKMTGAAQKYQGNLSQKNKLIKVRKHKTICRKRNQQKMTGAAQKYQGNLSQKIHLAEAQK